MTTERRLERLERENRWMRRIVAVSVAVAAAVFLLGQGKNLQDLEVRSLAVKKLTVKDKEGKERVTLGPNTFGGLSLNLWDNDGEAYVVFSTAGDGRPHPLDTWVRSITVTDGTEKGAELDARSGCTSLRLHDKAGRPRATLFADFEGQTTLFFNDKAGDTKLDLTVDADGIPSLRLYNKITGGGIFLLAAPDGTASVSLLDKDGRTRASLKTKADGTPTLSFFDKTGKLTWKAPEK